MRPSGIPSDVKNIKNITNTEDDGGKTIIPIREAAARAWQPNYIKPEWVRLPKPGVNCPISGLCRSTLYQLCKAESIKSVVLRQRGAARGIRLLNYDSLIAFLRSLGTDTCAEERGAA